MKETAQNIGAKIEKIVRERGIIITEFAQQINCVRKNVYDIFKRNTIDIALLARISKVLNYNFFDDLSKDYDLAQPTPIDEHEEERRRAVYQFLDVMPKVLRKIKYPCHISMGKDKIEENLPLPDFLIGPHLITVTIGETLEERLNGALENMMKFTTIYDNKGNSVLLCDSKYSNTQSIDIKLDYKTEKEWENIFLFALQVADKYYNEKTKVQVLNELRLLGYGAY